MACIVKPVSRSMRPRKPSTPSSPISRAWRSGAPRTSAASGRAVAVAMWVIAISATIGPARAWSVPVMVTVAERGRCFEFVTRPDEGPYVRWTYRLEPSGTGTRVTEIWDVEQLSPGRRTHTQAQHDERSRYTEGMLAKTLAALKATAES